MESRVSNYAWKLRELETPAAELREKSGYGSRSDSPTFYTRNLLIAETQ